MFGYVRPYEPRLLVCERELYRALYCGLCRSMRRQTGTLSSFALSYDMVFLALCRMLCGEERSVTVRYRRCAAHPVRRRPMAEGSEALDYAARVTALLCYGKAQDDTQDARGLSRAVRRLFVRPVFARAAKRAQLPELALMMEDALAALSRAEAAKSDSVDLPAELFGRLLGEIFAFGAPEGQRGTLSDIGSHLGAFIYVADAAEDYERDVRSDSYNPFRCRYGDGGLTAAQKQTVHTALMMRLQSLEQAMLALPFGDSREAENLLKNILYYGLPERISFLSEAENGEADLPPDGKKPGGGARSMRVKL